MIEGCSIHARLLGEKRLNQKQHSPSLLESQAAETLLLLPSASTIKHAYGSLQVQGYFALLEHECPVLPASARLNPRLLAGNKHWKQGHVHGFTFDD